MGRFRFPWTPVPDDEYIAKLRRSMTFWNRWRYVMLAANIGLVIAVISLAERALRTLMNLAAPPGNGPVNWVLLGFTCGATMGMILGWFFLHSMHGLITAVGSFQSERLLLKYYDAVQAIRSGDHGSPMDGAEASIELD